MKKTATLIAILLLTIHINAQKKRTINNKCLVATMAKELEIKGKDKKTLDKIIKTNLEERATVKKMVSSSKITKEESRPKMKEINRDFFSQLVEFTERPKKEIVAIVKDSRSKCKSSK